MFSTDNKINKDMINLCLIDPDVQKANLKNRS